MLLPLSTSSTVVTLVLFWLSPPRASAMREMAISQDTYNLLPRAILDKPAAMNDTRGLDGFNISAPHILGWMKTDPPEICSKGNIQQAVNIWFSDCGSPFVACLAEDSIMPLQGVMEQLARVPVGLRRFIGTLLVEKNNGTSQPGYDADWSVDGSEVTLQGFVDQPMFWHLAAESAYQQLNTSVKEQWKAAVDADGCVATKIAQQSYEQAFAEAAMVKVWYEAFGEFPPRGDCSCMQHSFDLLTSLPLFGASLLGNTCDIKDGLGGVKTLAPAVTTDDTQLTGGYTSPTPGESTSVPESSLTAPPSSVSAQAVHFAAQPSNSESGKLSSDSTSSGQGKDAKEASQKSSHSKTTSKKPAEHSTGTPKPTHPTDPKKSQESSTSSKSSDAWRLDISRQIKISACTLFALLAWVNVV